MNLWILSICGQKYRDLGVFSREKMKNLDNLLVQQIWQIPGLRHHRLPYKLEPTNTFIEEK